MFATLDTVTPEDVRKAANTWLLPEHTTVAILHAKGTEIPVAQGTVRNASAPEPAGRIAQPPVLLPVESDPEVAFKLWFPVGSQDDPPGKEGLAALVGAMISEGGTERLPYDKILEALFPLAAGYSASVDKEMTVVSGAVHKDNVERYTELLVDAITRPGFRKDDFERLRDQAISGIENELRFSSDEELAKATLDEKIFAGTPYGHLDSGSVASLKSITLDDVKAFAKAHFTRDSVVLGVGGGYAKMLPDKLAAELGRLPAGKPEAIPAPKAPAIEGRHVTLVEKNGASASISFGCPIDLHRGSRDYYALWIANSWLGEHRNSASHLYQVIRDARGLNYGDYSYIEAYPHGGRRSMPPTGVGRRGQKFEVWIRSVPRENALFALRAGLREVENLSKNGLTKEQFEFTKRFLKGYSLHFAEGTSQRLGYAVDDKYFGLPSGPGGGHLATFRKMLDEITLDEVNAAVKKYMQADNIQIAIVTPDASGMKDALASDAPSPVTYPKVLTPKPEILAEDKIIEAWPLKIAAGNVTIVPVTQMFAGEAAKSSLR
jgi:zinc protease